MPLQKSGRTQVNAELINIRGHARDNRRYESGA
jgi:hypothetical protein